MLWGGCLLFPCFAVRYFGILVSYAAEGIQKCEHGHSSEHIKQSPALLVVRELRLGFRHRAINLPPPILLLLLQAHACHRVSYSHRLCSFSLSTRTLQVAKNFDKFLSIQFVYQSYGNLYLITEYLHGN